MVFVMKGRESSAVGSRRPITPEPDRGDRKVRLITGSAWVALALVLFAAFCFLDQYRNAVDYERPSWLVVLVLSFPAGWVTHWLAVQVIAVAGLANTVAGELGIFVCGAVGTALSIYLWVAFLLFCLRGLGFSGRSANGRSAGAEFQRLSREHRESARNRSPLAFTVFELLVVVLVLALLAVAFMPAALKRCAI
jgi:hypothetical protein